MVRARVCRLRDTFSDYNARLLRSIESHRPSASGLWKEDIPGHIQ